MRDENETVSVQRSKKGKGKTGKQKKPLEYLLSVMNDPKVPKSLRVRAAVAAAQYVHPKRDQGGKKESRIEDAAAVAKGKLAPASQPRLVAVK
jgi:phage terminase small subunit